MGVFEETQLAMLHMVMHRKLRSRLFQLLPSVLAGVGVYSLGFLWVCV